MLRLKPRQRAVIVEKLPDLANLFIGVLVLGQFVGEQPFSVTRVVVGTAVWAVFAGLTMLIAGGNHDSH